MTPTHRQILEAGSKKYGNEVIMLIPLEEGGFVAMNAQRHLADFYPGDTPIAEISVPPVHITRVSRRELTEIPPIDPMPDLEIEL